MCSLHSNSHASLGSTINNDCDQSNSEQRNRTSAHQQSTGVDIGVDTGGDRRPELLQIRNTEGLTPPAHSFVPVIPANAASPRADNEVIIHPIPSEELLANTNNKPDSAVITAAEVHTVTNEITVADAVVSQQRRGRERRTPSLSSSEHGSNRYSTCNSALTLTGWLNHSKTNNN